MLLKNRGRNDQPRGVTVKNIFQEASRDLTWLNLELLVMQNMRSIFFTVKGRVFIYFVTTEIIGSPALWLKYCQETFKDLTWLNLEFLVVQNMRSMFLLQKCRALQISKIQDIEKR